MIKFLPQPFISSQKTADKFVLKYMAHPVYDVRYKFPRFQCPFQNARTVIFKGSPAAPPIYIRSGDKIGKLS